MLLVSRKLSLPFLSVSLPLSETTDKLANEGEVTCLCWLYNGTVLATGGRDSTIRLWDVSGK